MRIMEPAGCGHQRQTVKTKTVPSTGGRFDSQMSVVSVEERADLLRIRGKSESQEYMA